MLPSSKQWLLLKVENDYELEVLVSHTLGKDLFIEMMHAGFIDHGKQFKTGMLMNDEGKQLFIKRVYPKYPPASVDLFMQYSHVVTVNGQLKSDPGVILGFDLINNVIIPVLYRNDLLDHSIHVFQKGEINQANAQWLLEYWAEWFNELKANGYDHFDQAQLRTA
jgi:hypothetical protein